MAKPVFGLTGGIACGKSYVASLLKTWGVCLIDADRIARDAVRAGSPTLDAIARAFGADILDTRGELDRERLAQRIFHSRAAREQLNQIMHPEIRRLSQLEIDALDVPAGSYIVYEAALLVETGRYRDFDGLIVVTSTREQQIARLIKRNQLSRAQAEQRIDSQLSSEEKVKVANYVIENNGSIEELEHRTRQVHESIKSALAQ